MTTSLKIIALALAAALPVSLGVELSGITLPAAFDSLHVFTGLVVSLILLTAFTDYRTPVAARAPDRRWEPCLPAAMPKAPNPLAA